MRRKKSLKINQNDGNVARRGNVVSVYSLRNRRMKCKRRPRPGRRSIDNDRCLASTCTSTSHPNDNFSRANTADILQNEKAHTRRRYLCSRFSLHLPRFNQPNWLANQRARRRMSSDIEVLAGRRLCEWRCCLQGGSWWGRNCDSVTGKTRLAARNALSLTSHVNIFSALRVFFFVTWLCTPTPQRPLQSHLIGHFGAQSAIIRRIVLDISHHR